MRRLWPTAAQACLVAKSARFVARLRRSAPRPTAPEDTINTFRPARHNVATDPISAYNRPSPTVPAPRMTTALPTWIPRRFAAASRALIEPDVAPLPAAALA